MAESYYDVRITQIPVGDRGEPVFEIPESNRAKLGGPLVFDGFALRPPTQEELQRCLRNCEGAFLEVRDNGEHGNGVTLEVAADLRRGRDEGANYMASVSLSLEAAELLHGALGAIIHLRKLNQAHLQKEAADMNGTS